MQGKTLTLIVASVVFSAAGQLLLKSGAGQYASFGRMGFLVAAARDFRIVAGLFAWVASTLCWLYVLRVTPLSRAYGLTSLTYVFIFLASVFFLGERVRPPHVVGTLLIVVGIAFLVSGD